MNIFISHSSKDELLVEALIVLFEKALGLDPKTIRASSIPGYKFDAGVDTDEEIRKELSSYKVVVGVLTPDSLISSYVLFELGSRWGQKLFIAPIFANGTAGRLVKGPLAGVNALSASTTADVHQFLRNVGVRVGADLRDPQHYTKQVAAVVAFASVVTEEEQKAVEPEPTMRYEAPYYFRIISSGEEGPFCQNCWDTNRKAIRLQSNVRGMWFCQNCKNSVRDSSYVSQGPIRVRRESWDKL